MGCAFAYSEGMKTPIERFLQKVTYEPNSGCWLWTGSERSTGYGCFSLNRANYPAHRASYEFFVGPIPAGLVIDHACCVRVCVNPDHLRPMTQCDNLARGKSGKGVKTGRNPTWLGGNYGNGRDNLLHNKRKSHCPKGHPYSGDNLKIRPCGRRECRECHRLKSARQLADRKRRLAAVLP